MRSGSPMPMPSGMPPGRPARRSVRRPRREVAERLVGPGRIGLPGPQQVRVGQTEQADHGHAGRAPPGPGPRGSRGSSSVVTWSLTTLADRIARLDAPVVLPGPALLLGVAGGGHAEAAEAPLGGVELGARAGHRDPHRRVRLLQRLGQHVALRHREARARRRRTARRAHIRGRTRTNSSHVFLVSSGSTLKPPSSVHVDERAVPNSSRPPERMSRAAARSATRIGWFISGTQTTAPWPTRILRGLSGDRGQHHLGRRAVRVLLEEVVLDRPDASRSRARRRGGPARARCRYTCALGVRRERSRRRHLEEDPELHVPSSALVSSAAPVSSSFSISDAS